MKQRFTKLIAGMLALVMLVELLPGNLLHSLGLWAKAADLPETAGYTLPQPEELPTTVDAELPPTIMV